MTPRDTRIALQSGEWALREGVRRKPPEPPAEWPEYRRSRMRVAVRCALAFLGGKSYDEISGKPEGCILRPMTKARVGQYIKKGTDFLWEMGCFLKAR